MAIKSLHITNSYHSASGGIRTFYNALLGAANRHQRLVRLVVPAEQTSIEEVGEYGRIYRIAARQSFVLDRRYRAMFPQAYAWPRNSPLREILTAESPDLVEICDKFWLTYLPGVARRGWIAGLPTPTFVGLSCERLDDNVATYVSGSWAASRLSSGYMGISYAPRFDFHIAVSDYVAGELRKTIPERLRGRLHVAPMGVDAEWFGQPHNGEQTRARVLRRIGADGDAILLLYAGRLSKEKNLRLLPEVMALLAHQATREFRLVLAGDGPYEHELREMLQEAAPGRAAFLGHLTREELAGLYQAADVFVHPNPREPFGIAPLEAMASGLPLVAPASGGLLSYAHRGNAWLAQDSAESFATAVQSIVDDEPTRRRKIECARRTANDHRWERITASYFALYDRMCQLRAASRTLAEEAPAAEPATPAPAEETLLAPSESD
jgi:glycosyltransferase involved in cell wall biosynthesis